MNQGAPETLPFRRKNWILFGLGIAVIGLGYFLLSVPPHDGFWSLTMAPLLLIIGYCVVIPVAILVRDRRGESGDAVEAG